MADPYEAQNAPTPTVDDQQMVACDITGKMVPMDETVVLNGMRVSAEGKQILLDQMRTGDAMAGELEAPGSLRRFGCALLDGIIMGIVGAIVGGVGGVILGASNLANERTMAIIQLLAVAVAVAYFTILHATTGQTLGKMAGKFRVVKMDGSRISTTQALMRAIFFTGVSGIPLLYIMITGAGADPENALFIGYVILNAVYGLYALANAITVLAHPQKRALHDLIAGTRAVMIDQ